MQKTFKYILPNTDAKIREVNKYKKPTDNVKKTPAERKVALKKIGKKALNVVKGAAIPVAAMITLKKYSK